MVDLAGSRHALPYVLNLSLVFTELPLLDRAEAARAAGFTAVEYWWPFETAMPDAAEVDAFVASVERAGVAVTGLNFFPGDMAGGDRGLVTWTGREDEFAHSVASAIDLGERLGCRRFNALYGNRIDGADPAGQDKLGLSNLALASDAAARIDAEIVLEPLSGAEKYPLKTADDVLKVLDELGRDNVKLLADLYHLAVNGDDLDTVTTVHTGRIGHVQIADAPGRHQPGTGTLDIEGYLEKLQAAGYRGQVGVEYKPDGPSAGSLSWLPFERRGLA
ncbi:hydroxypyruvate isomerase [Amycolatopsis sp. WAC 01376]|uniref:hydroxypyruvate isomerase family protein n=1 Tax=Amycolatopsis sp. WAC 01376 TaxID=2203195 RepID=UPI000F7B7860|nr:TIM barrel protein [Amycolatopsis sp. WAC 01376]RSM53604.1 hydroxypyruvate isomerase [Amycolatopsis sp. WAC 01376]